MAVTAYDSTTAEASAWVQELWEKTAAAALQAGLKFSVPGNLRYALTSKAQSDIVHFSTIPALSVNDVTSATGAIAPQATAITDTSVTLNKWKEMSVEVIEDVLMTSFTDVMDELSQQFGDGLGGQIDKDVLGQHASITSNVVGDETTPESMSARLLLSAIQKLDDRDVPQSNRTWVFAPVARAQILQDTQFAEAWSTGDKVGAMRTGELGTLYGYKPIITSQVATVGSLRKNLLLHKDCLALALHSKVKIRKLAFGLSSNSTAGAYLSQIIVGTAFYGVGVPAETRGCVINTALT